MSVKRIKVIYLLLLTMLFITSCSVNPVTGQNEFLLMSKQQEITLGEKNYSPSLQAQGGDYYIDAELQSYVAGVGKKLATFSAQPNLPFEFIVLNNSVPNAWALPGGKIGINRGLLMYLEDEAQLAAVLSHEIVHAAARHSAAQMSRGTLLSLGVMDKDNDQLYSLASQAGAAAWLAKYGRDDELEADYYGMDYMAQAGYDLEGAVELQETFVSLSKDRAASFLSALFASHPPSMKRVEANRIKARTLPGGDRGRTRFQTAIRQLKEDEPAYEAAEKAKEALQKDDPRSALSSLDKAVSLQPDEFSFWVLRGKAWKAMDKKDNADRAFSTAIRKNRDHFSGYLERGILRYDKGERAKGLADIKLSYALLPTPAASYYLGEEEMRAKRYAKAIQYLSQGANGDRRISLLSQQSLQRATQNLYPERFVQARIASSLRGDVYVTLENRATFVVRNIELELQGKSISRKFIWPTAIAAGEHARINLSATLSIPVDLLSGLQVRVISAAVN
jgi:predicted Zn-dependent protease